MTARRRAARLALVASAAVAVAGCSPAAPPVVSPVAQPVVVTPLASAPTPTPSSEPTPTASRTPEPQPDPVAAGLPRSEPTHVRIPAIDVDTDLMDLGLNTDGSMEVPPGAFPAGWYTGAPTPGELGPAILAGHVTWMSKAAVFHRLVELEPGDEVEVNRDDGTTALFVVTRSEQYDKDAFPTEAVYGDIDHAGLRLITCGGDVDPATRSHEENTVVYAELVLPADT